MVIAIDGPAASGKSTTARLVAKAMGYLHIDTGAMYRAATLRVLRSGTVPSSEKEVVACVRGGEIQLRMNADGTNVLLDGIDVTADVRHPDVTKNVSQVSSYPGVREVMVREQRRMAASGGAVLEGRDIGTVVLPNADLKIFMVADVQERAARRKKDLLAAGIDATDMALIKEIEERDLKDSTRAASPLRKAADAVELDTSHLTIEQQVSEIIQRAQNILRSRQ